MKRTYKYIYAAMIGMSSLVANAQNLNSAYFTDEFKFRHDLNPAYGNEQTYISIPAIGNVNVSTQGNFGVKDVIMDNPLYGQPGEKKLTTMVIEATYLIMAMSSPWLFFPMVTTFLFLFKFDVEEVATVSLCQSVASCLKVGTQCLARGVAGNFCSVHLYGAFRVVAAKIQCHLHLSCYGE